MSIYKSIEDEQLLRLLANGNETAFAEIFDRYWEKMVSYAVRLTKSEDESADIVQEVFVSIWRRREVLVVKGTPEAYLFKSVRNLCLRYIEKNITKNQFLERFSDTMKAAFAALDQSDEVYLKQLQIHIDKTVAKLPPKMKAVYLLSRNDQLSYREIAQELDIAETTVKKQINNALKIISATMDKKLTTTIATISMFFLK